MHTLHVTLCALPACLHALLVLHALVVLPHLHVEVLGLVHGVAFLLLLLFLLCVLLVLLLHLLRRLLHVRW